MQHDYYLSEREAAELLWSRFINVQGKPGCNIPNDLHLEHLNRLCKTAIKGLGANKTESCITRVGKALGTIAPNWKILILSTRLLNYQENIMLRVLRKTLNYFLTSSRRHQFMWKRLNGYILHFPTQEIPCMQLPRIN